MVDAARARRLAGRIKQIVALQLRTGIKDPRLGMVTITDVRVTGDLRAATIFYTVLGDDTEQQETLAALDSATGILRSAVGQQTGIKFTPTLEFVADVVPETARHMEEAFERAREADEVVRAANVGAQYAGDADPYKTDESELDESDVDESEMDSGEPEGTAPGEGQEFGANDSPADQ